MCDLVKKVEGARIDFLTNFNNAMSIKSDFYGVLHKRFSNYQTVLKSPFTL